MSKRNITTKQISRMIFDYMTSEEEVPLDEFEYEARIIERKLVETSRETDFSVFELADFLAQLFSERFGHPYTIDDFTTLSSMLLKD